MKIKSRKGKVKKLKESYFEQVNLFAAGIDIGSESHYVAVPGTLDEKPVREFSCFTGDLERMADWLVEIGVQSVAMESTGIYWIPVFEILEERGLQVFLVNARQIKNVPGRKTDVLDCQWIQQLHTFGLLTGAFRPPDQIVVFRSYVRQREMLVRNAASHIQHLQKALRQMNLLLDNVVSDITGKTGMLIIRDIVSGERDAEKLAQHRDGRCKKNEAEIAQSLKGNYRQEHLFALRQALELYDILRIKVSDCDHAIEQHLEQFDREMKKREISGKKNKRKSSSSPSFDARHKLHQMAGVDLTRVDGLDEMTVLNILSETGVDMSYWKNEKYFSSWLSLCPGSKISGGKVLSAKTRPSANRAATALRLAARSLSHSKSALGGFYRRLRSRLGAPKAITATAHKLARIIYSLLKYQKEYDDPGEDYYEQKYKERVLKNLKKRASQLGFELVEQPN